MLTEKILSFTLLGAEWVLWLLLILSIFSIGIMVDRLIVIIMNTVNISELSGKVQEFLRNNDDKGLESIINGRSVVLRVFKGAYERRSEGVGAVEESAQSLLLRERLKLEKNLTFLGTLGNNAPFIGLFGTVLGIIRAFHDLSLDTSQGAAAVMAGISEALVATGVGLLVAIPAVIAYNFFQRRIKALITHSDVLVKLLIAQMKAKKELNLKPAKEND
ncbi:MAG: MotA/TolQ/ExbB proton channel family protein [Myxococcota bacterium]